MKHSNLSHLRLSLILKAPKTFVTLTEVSTVIENVQIRMSTILIMGAQENIIFK